jgi:aryl-alcohol dehydrogenase-like predicted oxidoreductase
MHLRELGRTGMEVSEVGYGAWGIGGSKWLGAEDEESLRALHTAIDLGVNFIDTALGYGQGHSEQLVGRVVRERSEPVHVATKIPPKNGIWPAPSGIDPEEAFPADHVIACVEQSLRNTGLDVLDLEQFHVWSDEWMGRGSWLQAIERLKSEGKIRAFGVSINDHQPANALALVRSGVADAVQVIYNVFDQSPEDELLPACAEHGVGVLARVPLDEGALTGRITPRQHVPGGRLPLGVLPRRPPAGGRRARPGDPVASGDRARAAGRDGAALHPLPPGGEHGHPRHAHGPQRRAQRRAGRRAGAARGDGGEAAPPPLGAQLLR